MVNPTAAITALLGAGALAGVAAFSFFGAYWRELIRSNKEEDTEKK